MAEIEVASGQPVFEAEPQTDYETERGKPMPNIIHGTVQAQLVFLLKSGYGQRFNFSSETSLATSPSTTPDICVHQKRMLDPRATEARETQMPLTTIEILSPSQSIEELQDKAWDIYFPAGVLSAWVVVPTMKAIQVLSPTGATVLFYGNLLTDPATGIQLDIKQVFEDIL